MADLQSDLALEALRKKNGEALLKLVESGSINRVRDSNIDKVR